MNIKDMFQKLVVVDEDTAMKKEVLAKLAKTGLDSEEIIEALTGEVDPEPAIPVFVSEKPKNKKNKK